MSIKACIKEILLSEYLDGELAADAVEIVREHLVGCRKCSAAYERMKADRSLLLECLPDPVPPAHLKSRLMQKINSAQQDRRHPRIAAWVGLGPAFPPASRALAFAAACVVFLAVLVSGLQVQRHFENNKILAEIDRSGAQWAAQDFSLNPFDILGATLHVTAENPFKPYLNER